MVGQSIKGCWFGLLLDYDNAPLCGDNEALSRSELVRDVTYGSRRDFVLGFAFFKDIVWCCGVPGSLEGQTNALSPIGIDDCFHSTCTVGGLTVGGCASNDVASWRASRAGVRTPRCGLVVSRV